MMVCYMVGLGTAQQRALYGGGRGGGVRERGVNKSHNISFGNITVNDLLDL